MHGLRTFVFRLYEKQRLRNWFYTLAFAIFVPVGFRFAMLAWSYGDWFDKPLSVIAGVFVGVTALVTLLRVWHVSPKPVVTVTVTQHQDPPQASYPLASDMVAAARRRAAQNRAIALEAAALGSTMGKPRYR